MIKKVNKNLVKVTSTILVGAMLLTGCGAGSDTVAKVNGDTISVEEYTKDYNIIKQNYEAQFGPDFLEQEGPDGISMEKVLKENVLDKLVVEQIIMQKAEKEKFIATDEEVNEEIKGFKEMVGGKEGFDNFLKTNDMDEEYFKSGIKKEITVEKYREKYLKELKLEDKELKEYYEANKDDYDSVKTSHILVEKEEEAKAISKQLKEGADFAELTKKSIEPEAAEREGDIGYMTKNDQAAPEYLDAAFKLKVDEISEPVKTDFGYHIIKVTDKKESYDVVKEDVKTALENEKFGENLEKLKEDAKVKTYMENIEKVGNEEKKEDKAQPKDEGVQKQEPQVEIEEDKDVEVKEETPKEENKEVEVKKETPKEEKKEVEVKKETPKEEKK